MIFVTVGSQKFQFDRLLKFIDELIENGIIKEKVFAQIGNTTYIPKRYEYTKFLDRNEFDNTLSEANTVITHGGTGTIIRAVRKKKLVIVVPRLKILKEHVDNHQTEIVKEFEERGIIKAASCAKEIEMILKYGSLEKNIKYKSELEHLLEDMEVFIES